jgi:hypothetical protein
MSSILDALRKLEQEKATREQAAASTPVRELALEPDLELERGSSSSPAKTAFLVIVGLLVILGIGAGATAASMIVLRSDTPVQQVATTAPSGPTETTTTTIKPVEVAPETSPVATEPKPAKVASAAPPKQIVAKKPEPPAKVTTPPATVAPKPEPPPIAPLPVANTASETPSASTGAKPETDIEKLPILSEAVRVRLGLPPLKINIVGIPSNRNPRASALINMQKVYVGENVPGTSARLVDVNLRGVSLDVNGQRYFLSRR